LTNEDSRAEADELRSQAEAVDTFKSLESLEEAASLYKRAGMQYMKCGYVTDGRRCSGWAQLLRGLAFMERNLVVDAAKMFKSASQVLSSAAETELRMLGEVGHFLALTAVELLELNFEAARLRYGEALSRLDKLADFPPKAIKPFKLLALEMEGELKYAQAYLLASKVDLQTALPVITDAARCYNNASAEAVSQNTRQAFKATSSGLQAAHRIWGAWSLQKLWKLEEASQELTVARQDLTRTFDVFSDVKDPTAKHLAMAAKIKGLDLTAQGLQIIERGFHALFAGNPQEARQEFQAAEETLRRAEETLSKASHFGCFDLAFAQDRRADSERLILALLHYHATPDQAVDPTTRR